MEYTAAAVLANVALTLFNLFILPLAGAWILHRVPAMRELLFH